MMSREENSRGNTIMMLSALWRKLQQAKRSVHVASRLVWFSLALCFRVLITIIKQRSGFSRLLWCLLPAARPGQRNNNERSAATEPRVGGGPAKQEGKRTQKWLTIVQLCDVFFVVVLPGFGFWLLVFCHSLSHTLCLPRCRSFFFLTVHYPYDYVDYDVLMGLVRRRLQRKKATEKRQQLKLTTKALKK